SASATSAPAGPIMASTMSTHVRPTRFCSPLTPSSVLDSCGIGRRSGCLSDEVVRGSSPTLEVIHPLDDRPPLSEETRPVHVLQQRHEPLLPRLVPACRLSLDSHS